MHLIKYFGEKKFGIALKAAMSIAVLAIILVPIRVNLSGQNAVSPSIVYADGTPGTACNGDSGSLTPTFNGTWDSTGKNCVTAGGATMVKNVQSGVTSDFCTSASTCISSVVYVFTAGLMSIFAYIGAYVFDLAVQLALNSTSYALDFLTSGWTAVRDIANMAFVFILIYIAFTIIFEADTHGTMKTLAGVVIMALLINFSFFLTRVVIDAGNILAVQFYNAIPAPTFSESSAGSGPGSTVASVLRVDSNMKDLTAGIMDAIQVQTLFNSQSFDAYTKARGDGAGQFLSNLIVEVLVYIAVAIVLAMLGFAFLAVGFKFLMRVVVLWFVIISAPLAFAMRAFSNNKRAEGLYHKWQDALIQFSFYPAIFLFMFLIITSVTKAFGGGKGIVPGIFDSLAGSGAAGLPAIGTAIANVGIRMGFVIIMLYFGLKAADSIVTTGSGMARGFATRVSNAAFSSGGWAARNTVARGAYALSRSQAVQDFAAKSFVGTALKGGLQKVSTSTLDVRGLPGLRSIAGKTGIELGTPSKNAQSGFVGQVNRRAAAIKKRAGELKPDEVDVQKAQEAFEKQYDAKNGEGAYAARVKEQVKIKELEKESLNSQRNAETFDKLGSLEVNPALSKLRREQAEKAREQIKKIDAELKAEKEAVEGLKKAGKTQTDKEGKERIAKFAERLSTRGWQNAWMPSRGSIKGAAQAVAGKTTHEKTQDLLKEMNAEHGDHEEGHDGGDHDGDKPHGGGGGAKDDHGDTSADTHSTQHQAPTSHDAHAPKHSLENVTVSLSKDSISRLAQKLGGRMAGIAEKQQKNTAAELRAAVNESGLIQPAQTESKPGEQSSHTSPGPAHQQNMGGIMHTDTHPPAANDDHTPPQQSGEVA